MLTMGEFKIYGFKIWRFENCAKHREEREKALAS